MISLARAALIAVSAAFVASYLSCAALRLTYPWEIEWMEGGMIVHAARVLRGLPIYAPPSLDFIAYFYTPLYAYVLAFLSYLSGGLSFALGRGVSLAASLATMGMLFYAARRERGWLAGVLAVGMYAALFRITGAFYDVARVDSLALALLLASALVAHYDASMRGAVLAALLTALAVFTKQTSAVVSAFIALALLLRKPSHGLVFAGVAGALGLCAAYALERSTQGWFSFYIWRGHQGHTFYRRGLLLSYWRDLLFLCPFVLLVPTLGAAFGRRTRWFALAATLFWMVAFGDRVMLDKRLSAYYLELWYAASQRAVLVPTLLLFLLLAAAAWSLRREPLRAPEPHFLWLCVGGATASAFNYSTQWAHANCFMPVGVFASLYSAILCAELLSQQRAALLTACAVLVQYGALIYDPRAQAPSAADRAAVRDVLAKLASYPGPVLMAAHPLYSYLRDGTICAHAMGFNDMIHAGGVRGVEPRLASGEFRTVVVDTGGRRFPGLKRHYQLVEELSFEGRTLYPLTGFRVRPKSVYVYRSGR
jgi:hypothetical protein